MITLACFLTVFTTLVNDPSHASMYKAYASYYDRFYQLKDYEKEAWFLNEILSQHQITTVLDVGCGTGSHLLKLIHYGYIGEGIDLNTEMVQIANTELHGRASQADMRTFNLNRKYDAVVSMFAVFNHNIEVSDARSTLVQCKSHLNEEGVLILDLYNPQSSGQKEATLDGVTKIMKWQLNQETQICESTVSFIENNQAVEEKFPLRVYSIAQITELLKEAGFKRIEFYDNYTFSQGSASSKNLIVVAKLAS
jgi:SAM-dependent methyltransferase